MRRTSTALAMLLLLVGGVTVGCGGDDDGDGDKDSPAEEAKEKDFKEAAGLAADQTICRADAKALPAPYARFPTTWTFPADTTVYDVEDAGETGVIVTAISTAPFKDVLDHLNGEEQDLGFKVTSGETEDDDAEANWTSDGFSGRWAIRKSGTCDGETVIQVLATGAS